MVYMVYIFYQKWLTIRGQTNMYLIKKHAITHQKNILVPRTSYYNYIKDARSVSWYHYNRSKIRNMLSILNKLALQKELQFFSFFLQIMCFGQKKVKHKPENQI